MDISKYPVTQPYGYDPTYPLNGGMHAGIDYGLPMATSVIVNGVVIGLSNNTGASTGPHLHVGKYANGQVKDPGVGNGFKFDSAVVYDTGYDATNGNFVRITGDGALWNYLHLKTTLVTKGQILKEEPMPYIAPETIKSVFKRFEVVGEGGVRGVPSDSQITYYEHHPAGYTQLYEDCLHAKYDEWKALEQSGGGAGAEVLKPNTNYRTPA